VHADPGPSGLHEPGPSGMHADPGPSGLHEVDSELHNSHLTSSTSSSASNATPPQEFVPRSSVRNLINHFETLSNDDTEKRLSTSMIPSDTVLSKIVVIIFTLGLFHFLCLSCPKPTPFSHTYDMYEAIT